MNDLVVLPNNSIPANFKDVASFAILAQEKLKSVRAEISAIKRLGLAKEVLQQKIREAQELAEIKTRAEVKLGELTAAMPKAKGNQYTKSASPTRMGKQDTKAESLEKVNISTQKASQYELMAANPEIVEQVITEARENDDIVSRSAVMSKIKEKKQAEKKAKRQQTVSEQISKPKTSSHIDIFTTDKKYRVIYADPPWVYNDKQDTEKLGGAIKHYPTMTLEEICALPIPAEENAVLFLWTTSPMLEDAFKVIHSWGFQYKSSFVWDKISHVMGHYNSVRHEFLLVCVRGSCTPDVKKLFDSVVSIERTEHSKKPEKFREIIDILYPVGERLEMFAREVTDGWDVWGNMA